MESTKTFHFIAVNFNNSKLTFSYIESVNLLDKKNCNVVIIDNNSDRKDVDQLEIFCKKHQNVTLIKSKANIGYFPALNLGLNHITRNANEYVIIGNNDLYFESDFVLKLDSLYIDENTFIIAPNILKLGNIHQNPHIVKKFSRIKRIYRKIYHSNYFISICMQYVYSKLKYLNGGSDRKEHDKIQTILMGYGACYILTPNFFKHYSQLDAPVFLMGEEGILANQVLKAGGVTVYHPSLVVNHLDHSSIGKLPNKSIFKYAQESYKYYVKNCSYVS